MSREQGPRNAGMRPTVIAVSRRPPAACARMAVKEAA
jgi:hypothetical protein